MILWSERELRDKALGMPPKRLAPLICGYLGNAGFHVGERSVRGFLAGTDALNTTIADGITFFAGKFLGPIVKVIGVCLIKPLLKRRLSQKVIKSIALRLKEKYGDDFAPVGEAIKNGETGNDLWFTHGRLSDLRKIFSAEWKFPVSEEERIEVIRSRVLKQVISLSQADKDDLLAAKTGEGLISALFRTSLDATLHLIVADITLFEHMTDELPDKTGNERQKMNELLSSLILDSRPKLDGDGLLVAPSTAFFDYVLKVCAADDLDTLAVMIGPKKRFKKNLENWSKPVEPNRIKQKNFDLFFQSVADISGKDKFSLQASYLTHMLWQYLCDISLASTYRPMTFEVDCTSPFSGKPVELVRFIDNRLNHWQEAISDVEPDPLFEAIGTAVRSIAERTEKTGAKTSP